MTDLPNAPSQTRAQMSVGFIGLGTMGAPMATRIASAGVPLAVYDIDQRPVQRLVARGATAASLEDLGQRSDVVMIAVVNEQQVLDVLGEFGSSGILARIRPGTAVLILSTIHPEGIRTAAAKLVDAKVDLLDTPVTGNHQAAAEGRLSAMVGGEPSVLERVRPVLGLVAARITHVGALGFGELAKIANNVAIAVTFRAVREALKIASAYDVDEDVMLDLLTTGGADSWVARNWRSIGSSAMTYPGGASGVANLVYKDATLALQLAHDKQLELPTLAVASQLMLDVHRAAEEGARRRV